MSEGNIHLTAWKEERRLYQGYCIGIDGKNKTIRNHNGIQLKGSKL